MLLGIPVRDRDGRDQTLTFTNGRKTILYVLSADCTWCQKNYNNIKALANSLGDEHTFAGIAHRAPSPKMSSYLTDYPLPFPVYFIDDSRLLAQLGLRATPTMLALGPDGRIQEFWVGALTGAQLERAEQFFGVDLPGSD